MAFTMMTPLVAFLMVALAVNSVAGTVLDLIVSLRCHVCACVACATDKLCILSAEAYRKPDFVTLTATCPTGDTAFDWGRPCT